MKFTDSMTGKVALMLCVPLIFEVSVISTSIILLDEIDAARIEKKKIGRVVYDYVDFLAAMISDYMSAITFMDGKDKTTRRTLNSHFDRAQTALNTLWRSCKENGIPCKDIHRLIVRKREQYTEGRQPPDSDITTAQMQKRMEGREVILDAIAITDKRINKRIDTLRQTEIAERLLFLRMSALLAVAFLVSVLLTVGLCLVISKMITARIAYISSNTARLANGDLLLPPLRGRDEIARLDENFHRMANALVSADLRNQMILDNSIDVVCALDRELHFLRVSGSSLNFWNISPLELIGRSLTELLTTDSLLPAINRFDHAREQLAVQVFEADTVCSGNVVPCLWSIQWSEKDELFICIAHDNTERKSAEARRQDLLAVISHDLRSPLTAARLSLEMMHYDKKLASQTEHLQSALAAVNYVISVTNDLIDLLRIQQSRLSLELKLSTIGDVTKLLQAQLENQAIEHSIDVSLSDDTYLMLDEELLPRIILSLGKHTNLVCGDKPISLTICTTGNTSATGDEQSEQQIVIRVEPSDFSKPADRKRTDSAKRISWEVSLALCHEIAAKMHGQIFTSWSTQGLPTYELRLPSISVG